MRGPSGTTGLLISLMLSTLLWGCASNPNNGEADPYGLLYEGASTAAYGTAFPADTPEEAYANAELASRSGDLDRALFEYIRGLRLEDDEHRRAHPLYRIGEIHHERGNLRLAEMAYRWALEADPEHGAAGTGLGILHLQRRHYSTAEAQLESVARSGHGSWRTHNALGILADLQGRFPQAARHYERALEASPDNPIALNNLGYSLYLAGDWAGAKRALTQAVRLYPDYQLAWRNLGLVHARQRDYDEALQAVARSGSEAEAYNDIGYVSMLEGRYEEAMEFFMEALRLSPSYYVTASENARYTERRLRRAAAAADPE